MTECKLTTDHGKAIAYALKAASTDSTRYSTNGVRFDPDGFIVGTDEHRLHLTIVPPGLPDVILDYDSAKRIAFAIRNFGELTLDVDAKECRSQEVQTLPVHVVRMDYPNWRILLRSVKPLRTWDAKGFADALKNAKAADAKRVKLEKAAGVHAPKRCHFVDLRSGELGHSCYVTMPKCETRPHAITRGKSDLFIHEDLAIFAAHVESEGDSDDEIRRFDLDYLIDAVGDLRKGRITVGVGDKLGPLYLEAGNRKALVMPIRR